jgi:hypothetical protein
VLVIITAFFRDDALEPTDFRAISTSQRVDVPAHSALANERRPCDLLLAPGANPMSSIKLEGIPEFERIPQERAVA